MHLYDSTIPSGNAYKVHLLLSLLGHRYQTTDLDILATPSETRRPDFLKINPNGRIPVLVLNDGAVLPESNAILLPGRGHAVPAIVPAGAGAGDAVDVLRAVQPRALRGRAQVLEILGRAGELQPQGRGALADPRPSGAGRDGAPPEGQSLLRQRRLQHCGYRALRLYPW